MRLCVIAQISNERVPSLHKPTIDISTSTLRHKPADCPTASGLETHPACLLLQRCDLQDRWLVGS